MPTIRRPRFEVRDAADGQVYVVLIAANGEPLSTSETFPTAAVAKANIDAQRRAMLLSMAGPIRRRRR